MKKDVYLIAGFVALIIVGFIVASRFAGTPATPTPTTSSSDAPGDLPVADSTRLIGDGSPSLGPTLAKVVVVEFLDPECEACRAFHPRVKKILSDYEGKVRFLVRFMPYHRNSPIAIRALEAADRQGKFWGFLDYLFEKQTEWGESRDDKTALIVGYAKSFGLDMTKFKKDFESEDVIAVIQRDQTDGQSVGVSGTPSFYVNGTPLPQLGEADLRNAIETALAR